MAGTVIRWACILACAVIGGIASTRAERQNDTTEEHHRADAHWLIYVLATLAGAILLFVEMERQR